MMKSLEPGTQQPGSFFAGYSHYINRQMLVIFFLGFASGLPFALCGSTLQAWFAVSHIDVIAIGALSLVGLPYIYKFIWAPLMDHFMPPLWGRRRGWILLSQLALIATIMLLAWQNPKTHPTFIAIVAFVLAFLSASQDVVIDAYRADLLKPSERGLGAAMTVAGYRLATLISGSVALIMAQYYGWLITYNMMALFMLIGVITCWLSPEPTPIVSKSEHLYQAVFEPFKQFLQRNNAFALLLLIVFYKLGEAFTTTSGSLSNAFLLQGIGFSLATVGTVNKGIGIIATLLGVFFAGIVMTRVRLFEALFAFGILQAIANLLFMFLALAGHHYSLLVVTVFIDNLAAGMGMAALIALLMGLCDPRYSAAQFALLSALSALPRVLSGPMGGVAVDYFGWAHFFFWTFILALPCLCLLWWLKEEVQQIDQRKNQEIVINV